MREVIEERRCVGDGGAFSGESTGGELEDLGKSIGSRDGESRMLPRGFRRLDRVDWVSTLEDRDSTLAARLAWSTCIRLRVDRISDSTASFPVPLLAMAVKEISTNKSYRVRLLMAKIKLVLKSPRSGCLEEWFEVLQ